MDESLDYMDYRPGHIHLRLNINNGLNVDEVSDEDMLSSTTGSNKNNADRTEEAFLNARIRDLTFRYESVKSDLNEGDIPDTLAAINLLGLLAFRLNHFDVAVEHFESALKEDNENVNALQNLALTYAKLNIPDKAETWNAKVQELLGRSEQVIPERQINHKIASSLAEHGYAYAYDTGLMNYEEKKQRLETSIRIYDRALNVGANTVTRVERRRWYFVMATIFVRIDTLMMCVKETEKLRWLNFNRAIHLLKEVAVSERQYHKSLAWSYLGILLERQSGFETTPMAVHDCGFTGTEPLDCYSKAIQTAEQHRTTLNRLAKVFLLLAKHELALGTVSMSLEMKNCSSIERVSSFHIRARINTSLYMRDLARCKHGSSTMPDRSLLERAQEDLNNVIELAPCLRAYMDMGQVCYYMGVDAIKESFVVNEEFINKALIYFSKALDCEMGDKLCELQLLRGKCLRVKGEERNALECFKRAIEIDRKGSRNTQAFRCLMETLVLWFSQGGIVKRDAIIYDVDNWINLSLAKFNNDAVIAELRSLSHYYTYETLELCKGTIKAGKMALAQLYFSIFPPSVESAETESNT